jgi:DnaJ-class molecular chaperone
MCKRLHTDEVIQFTVCHKCNGEGTRYIQTIRGARRTERRCPSCHGLRYHSVTNWSLRTDALPNSPEMEMVMRVRSDFEIPLKHPDDPKDFGGSPK